MAPPSTHLLISRADNASDFRLNCRTPIIFLAAGSFQPPRWRESEGRGTIMWQIFEESGKMVHCKLCGWRTDGGKLLLHDGKNRRARADMGHILWPMTHLTHQWTDPRPVTNELWLLPIVCEPVVPFRAITACLWNTAYVRDHEWPSFVFFMSNMALTVELVAHTWLSEG